MKIVVIQFPEATNVDLAIGSPVTVNVGSGTPLTGGTLLVTAKLPDPTPTTLPQHTHKIDVSVPEASSGPAIPT